MFILGLAGFQKLIYKSVSQPESAQLALKLIMALSPLIFMVIGIYITYKYKIDKVQNQIKLAIDETNHEGLLSIL